VFLRKEIDRAAALIGESEEATRDVANQLAAVSAYLAGRLDLNVRDDFACEDHLSNMLRAAVDHIESRCPVATEEMVGPKQTKTA